VIIIKNKEQIEGIRRSSKLAAKLLQETSCLIKPGINTELLNTFAQFVLPLMMLFVMVFLLHKIF